jgi:hypothetical protein
VIPWQAPRVAQQGMLEATAEVGADDHRVVLGSVLAGAGVAHQENGWRAGSSNKQPRARRRGDQMMRGWWPVCDASARRSTGEARKTGVGRRGSAHRRGP